jgi:hypothetical protein
LSEINLQLENTVAKRTEALEKAKSKLEQKNQELEKFNAITAGRELKMVELKKEIEQLKSKQ